MGKLTESMSMLICNTLNKNFVKNLTFCFEISINANRNGRIPNTVNIQRIVLWMKTSKNSQDYFGCSYNKFGAERAHNRSKSNNEIIIQYRG